MTPEEIAETIRELRAALADLDPDATELLARADEAADELKRPPTQDEIRQCLAHLGVASVATAAEQSAAAENN